MNFLQPDPPDHGVCPHCRSHITEHEWLGDSCTNCPKNWLFDADPNCQHVLKPATGGGVKCSKCSGWFCY